MKITNKLSINPDLIIGVKLKKESDCLNEKLSGRSFSLTIYHGLTSTGRHDYYKIYDIDEGVGFAKNTKAKIDAYFEVKEKMFSKSLELLEKQLENKQEN